MALRNPSGIYQGQAPLNPLPYVNIALQARARKQAKDEAIDKYYQNLPNTINDKGIRDQDISVINDYKNKIFEYGLKNKEALRNPKLDNGAAQFGLQKLMREAGGAAIESQNRAKTDLQLGKWRFSKEKEYIFKKPTFMHLHDAHNLPVNAPGSKGIDIASLDIPPKPLDLKGFRNELKQFKYSEGTPKIEPHPTDKLSEIVTTNPVFDEASKKALYDFAATKLHTDDSFAETIKVELANSGMLPNLVKIAKEQFGVKDVSEMIDEDLAAAFAYSQLPIATTRAKVQLKDQAAFDYKRKAGMEDFKIKEGIRQANRKELVGMREDARAAGEEQNNLWVENYINRLTEDAASSQSKGWAINKNGQRIKEDRIQLDPLLAKLLTKDGNSPDQFAVQPNGQYRPIFYKRKDGVVERDKDGNAYVDEIASVPMSKEQFKLLLGSKAAGVKQLNKEMTKPGSKTRIIVKKGELNDLK